MTKTLSLPAFFPDATYATIHSLPFHEILEKLSGIVVTTLHMQRIGMIDLLKKVTENGIQIDYRAISKFPDDKVILSDSGGFQVLSLIHRRKLGKITEDGAVFKLPPVTTKNMLLSPELSQQIQHTIGGDIRIVLDVPMFGNEDYETTKRELERTTRWAARAKEEFIKLTAQTDVGQRKVINDQKNVLTIERPLLGAVVQGGNDPGLRKESGKQLSAIGFDIYGFGGWPFDKNGIFNTKIAEAFVESLPSGSITYGMGVGSPDDIETCYKIGMTIFDCVLPTRNGRHGSLFVHKGNGEKAGRTFDMVRIGTQKYTYDMTSLDKNCDCPTCKSYTRAYLRFLFKNKNQVAYSLLSLHNVWWYLSFMKRIAV